MEDSETALTPEGTRRENPSACGTPERLTAQEREEMLHALGLTPSYWGTMPRWAFRNRFVLYKDCDSYRRWMDLVQKEMAAYRTSGYKGFTETIFFHVTVKGLDALGPEIKRRVPKEWRFEK